MPYIKEEKRLEIMSIEEPSSCRYVCLDNVETAGDLNYLITELVKNYFLTRGANYQAINDVVGALENAKVEFQRRVVAPYEDRKIKENGDVY